jgi:uncharacterized protein (TIGR01244 family)
LRHTDARAKEGAKEGSESSSAEFAAMVMIKPLTSDIFVAPQIDVATIIAAKAQGVSLIVNNRPEGESPDQTPGPVIAAAAREAGLGYVAIPVDHSGFQAGQIDALDAALAGNAGGKTLCYCRSGTRSTLLWSLARARAGERPRDIARVAEAAGYDVGPVLEALYTLSAAAASRQG